MEKNRRKTIIKLMMFVLLVNLPFLTIAHQIGTNIFLDSFENAQYYNYIKKLTFSDQTTQYQGKYLLIQKPSHPSFSLQEGDIILYYQEEGGIACDTISAINTHTPIKRYIPSHMPSSDTEIITNQLIIGKVVGVIDDNVWNALSLKTWDLSINHLNIRALLTQT